MCYHFLYVGTDLCLGSPQPGTSSTLQDQGYGLVYHVLCLFTATAFAGYSSQRTYRGWAHSLEWYALVTLVYTTPDYAVTYSYYLRQKDCQ